MGFLSTILGSAGKQLIDTVSNVVDEFTLSPEEKARLNQEMQRLVLEQFNAVQASVQARFASVMGIIQAEMAQGDNFTKRARPTIVYVGLALFVIQVLAQMFVGIPPIIIPTDFVYAWAGVVGVWSVGRTVERVADRPGSVIGAITGNGKPSKKINIKDLLE